MLQVRTDISVEISQANTSETPRWAKTVEAPMRTDVAGLSYRVNVAEETCLTNLAEETWKAAEDTGQANLAENEQNSAVVASPLDNDRGASTALGITR